MDLTLLRRFAAGAPPPVLVLAGAGGSDVVSALRATAAVEVVDTPRQATVLVAAGGFPGELGAAAARVHDQLPAPRGALWVPAGSSAAPPVPELVEAADDDDLGAVVVELHRAIVTGARPSSPDAGADVEPNDWRGVGPFGQGGKGMTGGVPYGRPLTGRAPDRDGLELDQLTLRLGPWLSMLPPGLVLDVRMQGDVVQEATVGDNPFPGPPPPTVFERSVREAVPVAELERARAAHHLRWGAGMARLLGLGALGARLDAASFTLDGSAAALAGRLARASRLRPPMAGIAVVDGHHAHAIAGPVARAADHGMDARGDDEAYAALGFEPVVAAGGDAWSRWVVRMGEAARSLELAGAAGTATSGPVAIAESPRGPIGDDRRPPSAVLVDLLAELLPGLEWGDAVVAVASLDLDVEEAASVAEVPA